MKGSATCETSRKGEDHIDVCEWERHVIAARANTTNVLVPVLMLVPLHGRLITQQRIAGAERSQTSAHASGVCSGILPHAPRHTMPLQLHLRGICPARKQPADKLRTNSLGVPLPAAPTSAGAPTGNQSTLQSTQSNAAVKATWQATQCAYLCQLLKCLLARAQVFRCVAGARVGRVGERVALPGLLQLREALVGAGGGNLQDFKKIQKLLENVRHLAECSRV